VDTHLTIRLAVPADAPALAALCYDFREDMAGSATESREQFSDRCRLWMEPRLGPGSNWRCWIAELQGVVAGNLWLQVIEKVPNPVPEAECHVYITNVYVAPEYRGSGAGEALVRAAMGFAREIQADSAILWPTDKSHTLYERHGFQVSDDIMQAIVTPGRDVH
jgi:GNAT superfamily N-acetyltransferase